MVMIMNSEKELSCIVLCGGMSRRMGEDKGSMRINEKPMILHVLETLNYEINNVIIVLNDKDRVLKYKELIEKYQTKNPEKKFQFKTDYITDEIKNKGPLSGIMTGLKNITTDYALILPCDSPYIEKEYIQTMKKILKKTDNTIEAIIPYHLKKDVKSSKEPLHSIYKTGKEDLINNLIKKDKLSVNEYIQNLKVEYVPIDNESIKEINFKNFNSKKDINSSKSIAK